jgi:hypothetical protein
VNQATVGANTTAMANFAAAATPSASGYRLAQQAVPCMAANGTMLPTGDARLGCDGGQRGGRVAGLDEQGRGGVQDRPARLPGLLLSMCRRVPPLDGHRIVIG